MLVLGAFLFLAGCGNNPETQIYDHLEAAVQLEDGFQEQQDKITNLEKQEQDLYNQIIELGIDELDKIKGLAQEAIASIDERTEKVKLEKSSVDQSREEFEKTKEFMDEIKDDSVKKKAEALYDTMEERYDAYDQLNQAYNESLTLEKELYELLQQEDLEQESLEAQIEKLNLKYQEVMEDNDLFNKLTTEYNELKKEFYKVAKINVSYDKES